MEYIKLSYHHLNFEEALLHKDLKDNTLLI